MNRLLFASTNSTDFYPFIAVSLFSACSHSNNIPMQILEQHAAIIVIYFPYGKSAIEPAAAYHWKQCYRYVMFSVIFL